MRFVKALITTLNMKWKFLNQLTCSLGLPWLARVHETINSALLCFDIIFWNSFKSQGRTIPIGVKLNVSGGHWLFERGTIYCLIGGNLQPLRIVKKCSKGGWHTWSIWGFKTTGGNEHCISHISSSLQFRLSFDFNDHNKWLQLKPDLARQWSHWTLSHSKIN